MSLCLRKSPLKHGMAFATLTQPLAGLRFFVPDAASAFGAKTRASIMAISRLA